MSTLLIPISPLSQAKSRLREVFTAEQIEKLIISMLKDLANTLSKTRCFKDILVYSYDDPILSLAQEIGLTGVKEEHSPTPNSFDRVINEVNSIAMNEYHAEQTIIIFLDTVLISKYNLIELNKLVKSYQIVICPAIHSAGISVLGRNPPNCVSTSFSDPTTPSLIALINKAKKKGLSKIKIYDSFRAGFDIDTKKDLVLGYEYLKILNLTDTHLYKFLKTNLNLRIKKSDNNNNRELTIQKSC